MNSILLGILVVAGIMTASAYAVTSISDVSHASTISNEIDIEKKSESMNAYFDGDVIHVKNTGKYDSEIAMFRFYDEPGTEVHRTIIPDTEGRVFGGAVSVVKNTALTSGDAFLQSHIPNSYTLDDIGIGSLAELTGEIVTKRGRVFPISFDEWTNQNGVGTGDGKALTDGLGVYLAIQHIDTNGKVYFGSGNNPGSQTDIRQYVGVGNNDNWAIAITDDDVSTTLPVPEFGKEYFYSSGSLIDVTNPSPNILEYSSSKIMSGTPSISTGNDGITISGTGTMVMKLPFYRDGLLFRGTLNNADVKIVTSPFDLIPVTMSGSDFVLYEKSSPPISLINTVETWHQNACAGGCHGGYYLYDYSYSIVSTPNIIVASESDLSSTYNYDLVDSYADRSCSGKNSPGCFVMVEYPVVGSKHAVVSSRSTGDDLLVTSLSSSHGYGSTSKGPLDSWLHTGIGTTTHTLLSAAPWNEEYSFDSNFEQYIELPNNSYIVANLNDGNVVIKGEHFDRDSDVFFHVKDLPPDVAYDISKNGITGVIGKTSGTGEISLSHDDVDFGIATPPGGILKIYPDSAKYLGSINNVAMIDVYNGYSVSLDRGTNLVYIPQAFVRLVFPVAVEAKNVSVDNTLLNDLNKNYAKNEALMIPVIPGAEIIYATINGEDVEVLMRYVTAPTQMKQVLQQSSTTSDHATSGTAFATSNISTSTFLTATHTGTMVANIDLKVGASADFSMNSQYVGGFTTYKRCNAYSTNTHSNQCSSQTVPNNPNAISNIDSLTSAHQSQLETALNNGQLSQITVEVDIFKNLQYVETKLIYTSNSAYAYVTTALSKAGYGASNQVHVIYPLTSISEYVVIPVDVGDMMEFVVRVNLQALGAPTPLSVDGVYSSYVRATTEFGGGVITVGMS